MRTVIDAGRDRIVNPRTHIACEAAARSDLRRQLLQRDLIEPAIAQQKHLLCPRQERRSVGHDNARDS